MRQFCTLFVAFFAVSPALAQTPQLIRFQTQTKSSHDSQFWREVVKNKYSVPSGTAVFPLAQELSGYLSSPDPQLRDDLAYTILDVWIVYRQQLTESELVSLLDEWQMNLRSGVGEINNDRVFRRSFSALCLAALAEHDLKTPFLGEERYRALLDNALNYLKDERDLRGFDPVKGWIHSTAHTADLLAALAANPLLKAEDQSRVLKAVSMRLSSAHQIFSYGEQDRLAVVVAAVVTRKDFNATAFHEWLSTLDENDRKVWKDSPPNDNLLNTFQNNTYMLQALVARLYAKPRTPEIAASLDKVTRLLQKR